tara:strand:- start:22 stop:576 length:555 start_codon:yes stop_codon:yes gene_type:complete
MKKILIILILLFPIHTTWGEIIEKKQPVEIIKLFGIKFGDNCIDSTSDMYRTKGKISNELFKEHIVYCTGVTKRIWKISTNTYFESEKSDEFIMCKDSLDALEKHFNEKYGVILEVKIDRDYEYQVQNNNRDDMYNKIEIICTRIGTGKEWNSVNLRLTVANSKMISEKKEEDMEISVIDKKGI